MKLYLRLTSLLAGLSLLTACAGDPPRKEFTPSQRIQSIALTEHAHLYAQDDVVLTQRSLDEKLSAMNESWSHDLHRASVDRGVAAAAFITQVVALAVCLGQNNTANVIGWCAGSVAMAFVSVPFSRAADRYESGVVDQYNQSRKAAPSVGLN